MTTPITTRPPGLRCVTESEPATVTIMSTYLATAVVLNVGMEANGRGCECENVLLLCSHAPLIQTALIDTHSEHNELLSLI